jgi:hypothetical protein
LGGTPFSQLGQQSVETANDPSTLRDQVVVAVGQEAQHSIVVLTGHCAQVGVT